MIKNISNLGDAAIYCDFGKEINKEINTNVIRYFKSIQKKNIKGITNITPSYNKLIISFDLDLINYSDLKNQIENVKILSSLEDKVKTIKVPICCDDEFALDIDRLNKKLKLSKEEILNNYLNKNYFCYMTGFVAGMPFLGDIDKKLRLNRLETPRVKVPKGSVAITEQFCNIYTFESPGGWNIIGNTPIKVFDKSNQNQPTIINPGDKVSFYQITKEEYLNWNDK
jgi:KipI family sensor histidine kinase inhibitor|tara:strand:+ start:14 stop:691 length:678 start_codon:yes stop_codon:yes gene_type:complete